jgi:hypothetical protein
MLLVLHITLGVLLLLGFITRFIAVLTKKIDASYGRKFVGGLGIALVLSGIGLEIITKSPLKGACLSSLSIIAVIIILEAGLSYVQKRKFLLSK